MPRPYLGYSGRILSRLTPRSIAMTDILNSFPFGNRGSKENFLPERP